MRSAYMETLSNLARKDKNVLAIISDNGAIVYDQFRRDYPQQYLNAGIAESNMVGMAAGLASCGKIPFAYTIGSFLAYRALESIRIQCCLQNHNVKIIGIGSGTSYSVLGPTHHSTEDIAMLNSLPNLVVLSPSTPMEVKGAVEFAYTHKGPVYIRLGTNGEKEIFDEDYKFEFGKGVEVASGKDITIFSTGSVLPDVIEARETIGENISIRVVNIHTIKPLDMSIVAKAVKETKAIVTVEDHNITGFGTIIGNAIAESGRGIKFKKIGLQDQFAKGYGSKVDIRNVNGYGVEHIINVVKDLVGNNDDK